MSSSDRICCLPNNGVLCGVGMSVLHCCALHWRVFLWATLRGLTKLGPDLERVCTPGGTPGGAVTVQASVT